MLDRVTYWNKTLWEFSLSRYSWIYCLHVCRSSSTDWWTCCPDDSCRNSFHEVYLHNSMPQTNNRWDILWALWAKIILNVLIWPYNDTSSHIGAVGDAEVLGLWEGQTRAERQEYICVSHRWWQGFESLYEPVLSRHWAQIDEAGPVPHQTFTPVDFNTAAVLQLRWRSCYCEA